MAEMKTKYLILLFLMLLPGLAAARGPAPAAAPLVPWPPPSALVTWRDPGARAGAATLTLHVLTFNDFHGNLQTPAAPDGGRRRRGGRAGGLPGIPA